ncbi:MAG: S-layer homology domain-containing protein [Clostridia bacterium]|nr:S-layer homology domain-containing protein [Clostridia bacterium]
MLRNRTLALILSGLVAGTSLLGFSAVADEIPGIVAPNDADYGIMLIDDLDAPAEEKIIYVKADGSLDNKGTSPEDALPTLSSAVTALGLEGGTVMIVGEVQLDRITTGKKADGQKRITITGYDDDATLVWSTSFNPNCDITIEYLNIIVARNWAYLNARGNDLILGKGLYVTRAEGITNDMVVRGGGDTNTNIEGDTNITVYSGTYTQICGGSRNGIVYGDTHITVYGGFISGLYGGNNNGSEPEAKERNVEGDSYITIYGGEIVNCDGAEGRSIVKGTRHLDISRYADFNPKWFEKFDEIKEYDPSLAPAVVKIPEVKADGAFIKGYEDNTFRPQNNITRAEAITVLSRLLASDAEISGKYASAFADVKADKWYYNNIAYLESFGALESLVERGNKMLPEQPITRIEVCQLVAYIGQIKEMKIVDFIDLDKKTAKDAIFALASAGIINGYDNGDGTFSFKPNGTITRAEFVTIIDRFLGRVAIPANAKAANKFTDTAEHWAADYIACASSEKKVDGKEIWKVNKESKPFELSAEAKTSAEYISELKSQAGDLTVDAITDGIDMIAEKRIAEIRNTKTDITVKGTAYYVSEDGNDDNDGTSPEKAWKTLTKVNTAGLKADDVVFFKRGDTFRGQLKTKSGVTYSAYGEGAKPNIFGWNRNSADESLWEETDVKGVWKYKEAVTEDVGNIIFNDSIHTRKVIRSTEKDGRHLDYRAGREFNTYKDLTENLTFFHDSPSSAESAPANATEKGTGFVYLRCEEGNPGKIYDSIEMAKKVHVISNGNANNVRIDNICVAYGGAHGISAGKCNGLTVTNCEFKWIGGSLQTQIGAYNRTWPTPYGNAIEIYGEAKNYTVDNCYIWQAYDAGVTHQGSNSGNLAVENVRYTNNVIEKCVYAVEIFYGESTNEKDVRGMDGVYIENNLLRMGGGFGHYQRPDTGVTALIRNGGILNNTTNFNVRNNIFDRSLGKIVQAGKDGGSKAMYYENLYVQKLGANFCSRLGVTYAADGNIAGSLVATGTEFDGCFILVEDFGY